MSARCQRSEYPTTADLSDAEWEPRWAEVGRGLDRRKPPGHTADGLETSDSDSYAQRRSRSGGPLLDPNAHVVLTMGASLPLSEALAGKGDAIRLSITGRTAVPQGFRCPRGEENWHESIPRPVTNHRYRQPCPSSVLRPVAKGDAIASPVERRDRLSEASARRMANSLTAVKRACLLLVPLARP
jgi:hypothetical protein